MPQETAAEVVLTCLRRGVRHVLLAEGMLAGGGLVRVGETHLLAAYRHLDTSFGISTDDAHLRFVCVTETRPPRDVAHSVAFVATLPDAEYRPGQWVPVSDALDAGAELHPAHQGILRSALAMLEPS